MAGAIIENMSTKKLVIVGVILLLFQAFSFMVGGLIGEQLLLQIRLDLIVQALLAFTTHYVAIRSGVQHQVVFSKKESLLCVLGRSEKLRNGFVTVVSKMGAYFHLVDWCSLCAVAFSVPPVSLRADQTDATLIFTRHFCALMSLICPRSLKNAIRN